MLKAKKIIFLFIFLVLLFFCYSDEKKSSDFIVTASTSWTAAFADLAGVDNVKIIAPADMKHPPEYEITVGDVLAVSKSDYFIYAGFERMMETLGDRVSSVKMIKINCDNSVETIKKNARLISEIMGTEAESQKRVSEYVGAIEEGRKTVDLKGFTGAKILCHRHQVYLAEELGFNVAGVFGPGPVTSKQIADAKNSNYDFIIDNVHNPVGGPLFEVSPESKYIIWRNFPEKTGRNSLLNVVQDNINLIF